MQVGSKVAYSSSHTRIQGAAEGEMAAETHARGADASIAGGKRQQGVHSELRVLVIGLDWLGDFELVALVGPWAVVRQRV